MRAEWATRRLAEICDIQSTLVDPREDRYLDLPHVGAGNIESGTGQIQAIKSAREEGLISGKFLFDESMVLYSKIRPYLKKVVRPDFDGLCSADVYPLAPKPGRAERGFLFYLLLTDAFTDYALLGSARAGMPKVNREHLFAYQTQVPPIAEQQRIVTILDEAFEGIATAKTNAEKNLQNARELCEELMQALFPEDSVVSHDAPSLDALCELIVDCEHKTAPTQENGIPSIRTPNIGKGRLLLDGVYRVSEATYKEWTGRAEPRGGDLILAREAPAGNVAVVPDGMKVCLGQRTVLIRPRKSVLEPDYLSQLLLRQNSQRRLLAHSRGATVQHINMKDIRAFKIAGVPSIDQQRHVVGRVNELFEIEDRMVAIYQRKLAALEELKKSLLHQAFSGRL